VVGKMTEDLMVEVSMSSFRLQRRRVFFTATTISRRFRMHWEITIIGAPLDYRVGRHLSGTLEGLTG
jgi:hypothetical protein